MKTFKMILHILVVACLTIISQIGGIIWIISFGSFLFIRSNFSWYIKLGAFASLYLVGTLIVVPPIAKLFGRMPLPITSNGNIVVHNNVTWLLNRHYVTPTLYTILKEVADDMDKEFDGTTLSYLDANFPFVNGFPLLPHISHNDGRKVDIAFFYLNDGKYSNLKPSWLGYGVYVEPLGGELSKTIICKQNGYWQYDYSKYFGIEIGKRLQFDQVRTKYLINRLVSNNRSHKLLIEPHLKSRMNLSHNKIRFQGCHSVRHDDHIHFQIY